MSISSSFAVLFAILAMTLWGFEEFFLKEAIDHIDSITTYIINSITGVLVHLALIYFIFDFAATRINFVDLVLAFAATMVAFLGYFSFYKALEKQKVSLISSLDESWIIVAILVVVLFFGERLNMIHFLAIAAVLFGAFLISAVRLSHFKHLKFIAGSGYELLAIIGVGLSVPIEKILVNRIGEVNSLFYLLIFVLPIVLIYKGITKQKWVKPNRRMLRASIFSGIADSSAFAFYIFALKSADVSVISPIVASNIVVTVILARIFLGEKMTPRQFIGASFILLGVAVLSYTFNT